MDRRKLLLLALVLCLGLLCGSPGADAAWQPGETSAAWRQGGPSAPWQAGGAVPARALSDAFFRTVFGLEHGLHPDAHRVKRYAGPVRFHITDLSGERREAAARAFLSALPRRVVHLRARIVARQDEANFRVILVRAGAFHDVVARELNADAYAMNARCLVGVSSVRGRIVRSTAVIVADDERLFRRCLVEEVLQGLGPMNDDARLVHSVFNDTSRHTTFTAFDAALMNIIYHPDVRPGMTGSEAHRVLPRVMRELGYAP